MSWIEAHPLQLTASISDTVREEISDSVIAGIIKGLGAEDIASSITQFYEEQSQWRALRIARTEVIIGYAEASLEGYRQSGVV